MILVYIIVLWVIPIFVGYKIGESRGRAGLLYGLFLGWIGVLIVAILPAKLYGSTHRECPHCKEPMRVDATACPHCQRDVAVAV